MRLPVRFLPSIFWLVRFLVGAYPRWIGSAPSANQRIYFANHTSHIDTIVLWAALPHSQRRWTHGNRVCLDTRELPQEMSGFELQAFFSFDQAERQAIDARQSDAHRLGLALQIGLFE